MDNGLIRCIWLFQKKNLCDKAGRPLQTVNTLTHTEPSQYGTQIVGGKGPRKKNKYKSPKTHPMPKEIGATGKDRALDFTFNVFRNYWTRSDLSLLKIFLAYRSTKGHHRKKPVINYYGMPT